MGSGVSLRVLMHAFAAEDLVWYSAIYGDHADDCIALAVDRESARNLENVTPEADSPILTGLQNDLLIEEHPLTESVQAALGVVVGENEFRDDNIRQVKYRIYIHDDCFFSVQPLDARILDKLVECILQQHSFYLGHEVDWSGVRTEIVDIVRRGPAIDMKSDPRGKYLRLICKSPGVKIMETLFSRRPSYRLDASSGKARFISRPRNMY